MLIIDAMMLPIPPLPPPLPLPPEPPPFGDPPELPPSVEGPLAGATPGCCGDWGGGVGLGGLGTGVGRPGCTCPAGFVGGFCVNWGGGACVGG